MQGEFKPHPTAPEPPAPWNAVSIQSAPPPTATSIVPKPLKAAGTATLNYFMNWPRVAYGNLDAMVYNSLMASMTAGGFAGKLALAAGGQAKLALGASSSSRVSSPQNTMPNPFVSQPSLANDPFQNMAGGGRIETAGPIIEEVSNTIIINNPVLRPKTPALTWAGAPPPPSLPPPPAHLPKAKYGKSDFQNLFGPARPNMLALPAYNPVQGTINHLPQGSTLGPPSQQPSQAASSSSSMPNPPMTSKVATGYQSSSVPVRRAAAAGFGSGTRIKSKTPKPHIKRPGEDAPKKNRRMSYKRANEAVPKVKKDAGVVKPRRVTGKQSDRMVKEKPIR